MNGIELQGVDEMVGGRSTSAVLVDALREEIIHGRLKPGERLRQDAIATRFGVSQTVAREAFKELVAECFLASEPRRGVSVAPMSADEAEEMTQLRSVVESQALAWAIQQMTPSHIESAEKLLNELDKAKSVNQIILLNAQFHRLLYSAAKRPRTLAMVETLRLGFERYLRYTWESTSHLNRSQEEHWKLLDLCKRGEAEEACDLLRSHISATGAILVKSLSTGL